MSDQSYDKVRQQIKNLGLKHKGGGSYEKDGKYFGRVTKQRGQYILKKAGETIPGKALSKAKEPYKPEVKKKLIGVINNLPTPDSSYSMDDQPDDVKNDLKKLGLGTKYDGDKVYKKMMKAFDQALKPDDKEGQRLKKKIEDKWKKTGSLGGVDKNDKKIFGGEELIGDLFNHIRLSGERESDETGPETDVKDDPKTIDKVEKKTYEVKITIPYENVESGAGQDNEDPDDDEQQPDDVEIFKKIKAASEEEAEARAQIEADEAYDKLKKRNKYDYHEPDYDMMDVEVEQISESYERKIMVKENIKNMIDNLDKGDNAEAQKNFNDAMADKVSATLDDAKTDVAKSMFTGQQGVQAPEVDVFSGENIETPAEETPSEEDAQ